MKFILHGTQLFDDLLICQLRRIFPKIIFDMFFFFQHPDFEFFGIDLFQLHGIFHSGSLEVTDIVAGIFAVTSVLIDLDDETALIVDFIE